MVALVLDLPYTLAQTNAHAAQFWNLPAERCGVFFCLLLMSSFLSRLISQFMRVLPGEKNCFDTKSISEHVFNLIQKALSHQKGGILTKCEQLDLTTYAVA
jgi:hypothetical protein